MKTETIPSIKKMTKKKVHGWKTILKNLVEYEENKKFNAIIEIHGKQFYNRNRLQIMLLKKYTANNITREMHCKYTVFDFKKRYYFKRFLDY